MLHDGIEATKPDKDLAKFSLENHGLFAIHNFPCPVCQVNPAVFNTNKGVFGPCCNCAKHYWYKVPIRSKIIRWFLGIGEFWYRS